MSETSIKRLFDLTGKVALVTGGSRGLGEEMAEGLAESGAALMLLARREQWLESTVRNLRGRGFQCEGLICDVARAHEVRAAVEKTLQAYGRIDILINGAGIHWAAPAEEMPLDKWQSVIDVDLTGAFLLCQAVGRGMIERRYGRIINISSISGLVGGMPETIHASGYAAAKGGLIALTRELAAKWAQYGIRVNAIAPGFFHSRMTDKVLETMESTLAALTPMKRIGQPGELKGVAVFLAADASNFITGHTLVVDGGGTIV